MATMANGWFPTAVYSLCFLTSSLCAWLLMRSYLRARGQMLFWTGLCFMMLAINNLIVILDMFIFPDRDLILYRIAASLVGVSVLLYGFIGQGDQA
jgi:cytochrome c oxidase subunit IV